MKQYIAVIHKDDDSAFGVTFPDLPTVFSAADDEGDLLRNAASAVASYFDTEEAVEPSPMQAIREAAAEDLAQGAFLMSVPYVGDDKRTVKATYSMDAAIRRAIDVAAKQRGVTKSAFIANAAMREIEGQH